MEKSKNMKNFTKYNGKNWLWRGKSQELILVMHIKRHEMKEKKNKREANHSGGSNSGSSNSGGSGGTGNSGMNNVRWWRSRQRMAVWNVYARYAIRYKICCVRAVNCELWLNCRVLGHELRLLIFYYYYYCFRMRAIFAQLSFFLVENQRIEWTRPARNNNKKTLIDRFI